MCVRVCVRVSVCVRAFARVRSDVYVCVHALRCVRTCVCVCVRTRMNDVGVYIVLKAKKKACIPNQFCIDWETALTFYKIDTPMLILNVTVLNVHFSHILVVKISCVFSPYVWRTTINLIKKKVYQKNGNDAQWTFSMHAGNAMHGVVCYILCAFKRITLSLMGEYRHGGLVVKASAL